MGCHRNHAISHSPNQNFFEDTFVSHPGGPNKQFGTHEKLSWGVQGNLNWMPGYNANDKNVVSIKRQKPDISIDVLYGAEHSIFVVIQSNSMNIKCPS